MKLNADGDYEISWDELASRVCPPWCVKCGHRVEKMLIARQTPDHWLAVFWCHGDRQASWMHRDVLAKSFTHPDFFVHATAF